MPEGVRVRVPSLVIKATEAGEDILVDQFARVAQLVELHLAKVEVAGSSPVSRF